MKSFKRILATLALLALSSVAITLPTACSQGSNNDVYNLNNLEISDLLVFAADPAKLTQADVESIIPLVETCIIGEIKKVMTKVKPAIDYTTNLKEQVKIDKDVSKEIVVVVTAAVGSKLLSGSTSFNLEISPES